MRVRKVIAASVIAVGLGLGSTVTASAAPVASISMPASIVDWDVRVSGSTGNYHAVGLRNGSPCWSGPQRWFKYKAVNDGARWLQNPYCP